MIGLVTGPAATPLDALRSDAWEKAQEAYGTAYIFERRARRLRNQLNILNFVGLAVPVLVGSIVLGYGLGFKPLGWLVPIAIAIAIAQAVVFSWSLVAGWV